MTLVKSKHHRKLETSHYWPIWLNSGILVTAGATAVEVCLWEGEFLVLSLKLFFEAELFVYAVELVA